MDLGPAVALIKEFEGFKSEAYQDMVGVWTIGYGTTLNVKEGDTCTEEEASTMLLNDLTNYRLPSLMKMIQAPVTDNQVCALLDFCYNLGMGSFQHSTLRQLLNDGTAKDEVAAEFLKWDKAGGKVVSGLLRRRTAERDLFLS